MKTCQQGISAVLTNPAGMVFSLKPGVAIDYTRPYHLKSLSQRVAMGVLPTNLGHFSILFGQAGYSASLINRYAFTFSRSFGRTIAAGLQLNALSHRLHQSGTYWGFYSNLGLSYFPNERVLFGFWVQNPEQAIMHYPDQAESLPVRFALGFSWQPVTTFKWLLEMEKEQTFYPRYKGGLELTVLKDLKLRGGVQSQPVELSLGIGYRWRMVTIDVGLAQHQQLGITTGASVAYFWNGQDLDQQSK
jgi:hypothetical protein